LKHRTLVFQPEVASALHEGILQIVEPVRVTLGPLPRYVACTTSFDEIPEMLDKGSVIARRIVQLSNPDHDMGAMLVREMLWKMHTLVGDSTATAAVIFEAVYSMGRQVLASGGNAMRLREALLAGADVIVAALRTQVTFVEGEQSLIQAARAVVHDEELAQQLGEIFAALDAFGAVDIRTAYARETYWEYIDGAYWRGGLITEGMTVTQRIEVEDPAIILTDLTFTEPQQIAPAITCAVRAGVKSLIIFAEHINEAVGAFLAATRDRAGFRVYALKLPEQYRDRTGTIEDMRVLVGGQPILKATGATLQTLREEHLGRARRVWADRDYSGISGAKGDPIARLRYVERLRQQTSRGDDLEKRAILRDRVGKLMGGSAVLWVDGLTENDAKHRKQAASSAVETLRSIVSDGVVPGGGIAFYQCKSAIDQWRKDDDSFEVRAARRALSHALEAPMRTIFENSGFDASQIVGALKRYDHGTGFDVLREQFVIMSQAGIMDSAAASAAAVQCAVSAAATALTIDVLVHTRNPSFALKPGD
jgi:chaperonin GroEL